MTTVLGTSLIISASTEALLIVGIAFTISAALLFALALEAGTYPRISAAIRTLRDNIRNGRHNGPNSGAFPGNTGHHPLPQ